MHATESRIVVYERQSRWAPVLRRELGSYEALICEARSSSQARDLLQQHRTSLLVIEWAASALEGQLDLLNWLTEFDSSACIVSVGPAPFAALAAEAGASLNVAGLHRYSMLTRLALRHVQRCEAQEIGRAHV